MTSQRLNPAPCVLFFRLTAVLVAWAVASTGFCAEETSVRTNNYPRILYDNDSTCMGSLGWKSTADFPAVDTRQTGLTEQHFGKFVSDVAGLGVDVGYKFCPGLGRVPVWQKTSFSGYSVADHLAWYRKTYQPTEPLQLYARHIEAGGDWVKSYLDAAAVHPDLKRYLSVRMNDPHCIWDLNLQPGGTPTRQAGHEIAVSRFLYENWRTNPTKHFRWPAMTEKESFSGPEDYASPEVRDMRMRIIKDLICNYEPQGLELNFMRWTPYFKNSLPVAERKSIMTAFIREIRKELDRSGKNRMLILKLPQNLNECNGSGFDLPALNRIADMVVIAVPYFNVEVFKCELAQMRKQLPDVGLFVDIHYQYDGNNSPSSGRIRFCCTKSQLYEAAGWAYGEGVDGISLFNFQYYRPSLGAASLGTETNASGTNLRAGHEPYFDVIPRLADKQWCLDYYNKAFKLDLGGPNQKILRLGWTGWSAATQEQPATKTFETRFNKALTIDISAGQWFTGSDMMHDTGDLLRDGVSAVGPLTVTIKGLTAGNYTLTTFHHDPAVDRGSVDIDVQDADGTRKGIVKDLDQSTGSTPDPYAEALFDVRADGNPVAITLRAGGEGTGGVSLNGLVIIPRSSQPAAGNAKR